ncbi:MAG: hypothetical protein ACHQPI_02925 [Thermoanaerobaculia bacterium]
MSLERTRHESENAENAWKIALAARRECARIAESEPTTGAFEDLDAAEQAEVRLREIHERAAANLEKAEEAAAHEKIVVDYDAALAALAPLTATAAGLVESLLLVLEEEQKHLPTLRETSEKLAPGVFVPAPCDLSALRFYVDRRAIEQHSADCTNYLRESGGGSKG